MEDGDSSCKNCPRIFEALFLGARGHRANVGEAVPDFAFPVTEASGASTGRCSLATSTAIVIPEDNSFSRVATDSWRLLVIAAPWLA